MVDTFEFNRGYLIACCDMMNLHGDSRIASDTLAQAGITQSDVKKMDLTEYDAAALADIRQEHPDAIAE